MTIRLSSKGGGGVFPKLSQADFSGGAGSGIFTYCNYGPGFDENGDYFDIPVAPNGPLYYYNSAGTLQWSKAVTDVNAACDAWVGFVYDKTDALVYAVAVDYGASPRTYYLCSINKAGTLTNIGNDTPTTDFSATLANFGWLYGTIVNQAGTTSISRVSDGSGNIFVMGLGASSNGLEVGEINISTGAFVSDPASVYSKSYSSPQVLHYRNPNGIYCGYFSGAATRDEYAFIHIGDPSVDFVGNITVPSNLTNINGTSDGWVPIQWGSYVVLCTPDSQISVTQNIHNRAAFDAWLDECALKFGI